jgi:hypothetical protein
LYHDPNEGHASTMKAFLKQYGLIGVGIVLGAIGGYLYYHFVGCASGSCAITASPVNSTLYGAVMGGLLLNIFRTKNFKAE